MILQYKGFNNNWTYQEADSITWANVWVGKETKDYRKDGVRYNELKSRPCNTEWTKEYIKEVKETSELKFAQEMHKAVDNLIRKETSTGTNEIVYLIGDTPFDQMENVCVVIMNGKNINVTYVFTKGVYLLNNNGGTVQKIA